MARVTLTNFRKSTKTLLTENIINTTTTWNAYDAFKENAVSDVSSVEEFLKRYYKKDRYDGRGLEYAQLILVNCKQNSMPKQWEIYTQ